MKFFAPSYKRAKKVLTHKILPSVVYCVHEFEAKSYEEEGHAILVLPDNTKGNIAGVRNWILNEAQANKTEKLLVLDDDIKAIGCFYGEDKAKYICNERLEEEIAKCFMLAEEWGCTLWGVNCGSDKGSYREYSPFSCKGYCSASLHGFDIEKLGGLRYDVRLPLKEDYDLCLQIANRDRKLLRFNYMHMLKDDHLNVGGCAMYRNLKVEREQMDLLVRKWGKKIVREDSGKSQVNRKKEKGYDINPIIKVPIGGV